MKNKTLLITRLINSVLLGVLFLFVIVGCSSKLNMATKLNMAKRDEPVSVPKEEILYSPSEGSIWPGENGKNSLFTDNKARHVNDIITIEIDEASSGNNSADTDTSKDTETSAGISSFFGLEKYLSSSTQIGASSKNSLKGSGETSRDGELQAKITARVVQIMENGNLVIEGRRQLTVNAEEQYIIISGVIRPEDVTSDNVISSEYIADARIVYTGKGIADDKMRPGLLTRAVDWIWPF